MEVEDISASSGRQIAYTIIHIIITDINDNSPKFSQNSYKGSVTENTEKGANIVKVVASDADVNRSIYYKLEGEEAVISHLKIERRTGQIIVADNIDREHISWLNFTVSATDSGVPAKWSYADVSIEVQDENDNSPVFIDYETNIIVKEDVPVGHIVMKVTATDEDKGEYGQVTYFLDSPSSSSKFQINPGTGRIIIINLYH